MDDGERAASALRTLTGSVSTAWAEPGSVRAVVRRRRVRAALLATTVAAVAVAALLVPSHRHRHSVAPLAAGVHVAARLDGGLQLVSDTRPLATRDSAAMTDVARTEQAFTVALLKELDGAHGANVAVSPASLALALSMLQNGAAGNTRSEIAATQRSTGVSTERQNAGWAGLTAAWQQAAAQDRITLQSANSLFVQNSLPVKPGFLSDLAKHYSTGVWTVDFQKQLDKAVTTMNAWTSQQTHGKITRLFEPGQLDATTLLVIANAVYFHAAWATPFDPHASEQGQFFGPSETTTATFMTTTAAQLPTAATPTYQAAQLPYVGRRFAALAVMPTTQSLAQFTTGLTPSSIQNIVSSLATGRQGPVDLPRFTTTTSTNLKQPLIDLGMPTAFTDRADFTGLSPEHLEVQSAQQRVFLSVGEKGTEAAAVTGISMNLTSGRVGPTFRFDHPFLFLIRDTVTGAILFAAQIRHPTT